MKKVHIYSTPTCHFCHMAKDFLTSKGIPYEDFDVAMDLDKRKEMVEKSGQMGVPVVSIDGELIVGFDKPRIMQLLDIKE